MIQRFNIKNLFGAFNHDITFTKAGEITLVLGENGLGKTIILKIIKAFFDRSFAQLRDYEYDQFTIYFDNSKSIVVKRIIKDTNLSLSFELFEKRKKLDSYNWDELTVARSAKGRIRHLEEEVMLFDRRAYDLSLFPNDRDLYRSSEIERLLERFLSERFDRVGINRWYDRRNDSVVTTNSLIRRYSHVLPKEVLENLGVSTPSWLLEVTSICKVKLIETQRLLVQAEEGKYRSSVTNYSKQLVDTIKNKRSEATDLASKLDRSFPNRLITRLADPIQVTGDFIITEFAKLKAKRELLSSVGLLDIEEEELQSIEQSLDQETLKEVLSVYVEDTTSKLATYDELANRIKLLVDTINKRFKYKKFSIDKNEGFVFTSPTNAKKEIPLSGLSSGEQHELVLFFELLFNTEKNSLLLIDEPEISLHISWQKEFIDDLSAVTTLNNLSVIIATHSPDIIGNHWPLTVELKGPVIK